MKGEVVKKLIRVNIGILYRALSVLGLGVLFCLIAENGPDSYFLSGDESGYFANLELINRYGVSTEFLRHFSGMAGPLHPILHWMLLPLTGGVPPGIRFVNFVILLLFLWIFRKDFGYRLLSIPMTFICAGYAMTEFPSMLFLLISLFLLKKENSSVWQLFLAGFCLSISIAGRWNYLILLPLFYYYVGIRKPQSIYGISAFLMSSLIFPIWIGFAWQGISPPEVSGLPGYGFFDVNPENFVLSCCFAAMMVFILAPRWFSVISLCRFYFFLLLPLVFALNFCFDLVKFLPAKSLFNHFALNTFPHLESSTIMHLISGGFGAVAIVLSLLFLHALYLQMKKHRDADYFLFGMSIFLVLISTIKITHTFSARYPYQVLPFLLLILKREKQKEESWWELALGVAGLGWGILSWISYQHIYS